MERRTFLTGLGAAAFAVMTGGFSKAFAEGPKNCQVTVQPGDWLYRIGRQFGVPPDGIVALNPQLEDPNKIYPGQKVNVCPGPNTGGPSTKDDVPKSPDGLSPDQAWDFIPLVSDPQNIREFNITNGWYRVKTFGQGWQVRIDIPDGKDKTVEAYSVEQLGELSVDGRGGSNGVEPKGRANGADGNKYPFTPEGYSTMTLVTSQNVSGPEGSTDFLLYVNGPAPFIPIRIWAQLR